MTLTTGDRHPGEGGGHGRQWTRFLRDASSHGGLRVSEDDPGHPFGKPRRTQARSADCPRFRRSCMTRTHRQLSAEERGVIMAMMHGGRSACVVGVVLEERAPSTITRELRRNGWRPGIEQPWMGRPRVAGGYNAHRAGVRASRVDAVLFQRVTSGLAARRSALEVVGCLCLEKHEKIDLFQNESRTYRDKSIG